MNSGRFRIIRDPTYGYRRLDPLPDEEELTRFYKDTYYELIRKGGVNPLLRRFIVGGQEAEGERAWLHANLYSDISCVLRQHVSGKRILDIGCGTGELLLYLKQNGFDVTGIEPSLDGAAIAESQGLTVHGTTLEKFAEHYQSGGIGAFDAITLLNVLEHIPNPAHVIEITRLLLAPGGIVCVQVPNDFSEMQSAAQKQLGKESWWIAIPDHINYFDFKSVYSLLEQIGFEVVYSQGNFPMEIFLLMGDDYLGNSDVGNRCHQKRIRFETALPSEFRRSIYRAFAANGVGRECLVFGRPRDK